MSRASFLPELIDDLSSAAGCATVLPTELTDEMVNGQLLEFAGAVGSGVVVVAGAIATEASGPVKRWLLNRRGVTDSGQSAAVRGLAIRLASRRRSERLEAARLLGDLRDATALPALFRAAHNYRQDGELLEAIAGSLVQIGDVRALPLLRELSTGHHMRLMQVAREGVAQMAPRATLLRGASAGGVSLELLRPAGVGGARPEELLRPTKME